MKIIKTKSVLTNLQGVPLQNDGHDLTIGEVLSLSLSGKVSNPYRGYVLAKKFATEAEVELMAEDVVFIKKALEEGQTWLAIVTGQVIEMLESSDVAPKKK